MRKIKIGKLSNIKLVVRMGENRNFCELLGKPFCLSMTQNHTLGLSALENTCIGLNVKNTRVLTAALFVLRCRKQHRFHQWGNKC